MIHFVEPIALRRLEERDEEAFFEAVGKWVPDPAFIFLRGYEPGMSFRFYLELIRAQERGECLPEGFVPDTYLFGFLGPQMVGRLSLRHTLTDFLLKLGGHIGYGVLPEFRRQGFATSMLRQSLPVARSLGIKKVLVTCDDTNIGSIKTIEGCGGLLENTVSAGEGQPLKRRYWITI